MSKKLDTFQIEIPCNACPMAPVCTKNGYLKKIVQDRKFIKGIEFQEAKKSEKECYIPIPESNSVAIYLYIMCRYRTENPKERTYSNFSCSVPCTDCIFSKDCKYGTDYNLLLQKMRVYSLYFKVLPYLGPDIYIPDNDNLSYFLSVHCNCKGGLTHDPA